MAFAMISEIVLGDRILLDLFWISCLVGRQAASGDRPPAYEGLFKRSVALSVGNRRFGAFFPLKKMACPCYWGGSVLLGGNAKLVISSISVSRPPGSCGEL